MATPEVEAAAKSTRTEQDARMARILATARGAAFKAARAADAKLPPEKNRGLDCGFAWVVVKPARGPFVTWCKRQLEADAYKTHAQNNGRASMEAQAMYGHLREYGGGGWEFWCTGFYNTQSISVHRAAAEAFAHALMENDIQAEVGSRLD